MKTLVTGATGYVGGRLVTKLLERGHSVRALVRDPSRIAGHAWAGKVEVAQGDLLKSRNLVQAFEGMDVAYYFVHSMMAGGGFAEDDRMAARRFVRAAKGVGKVIYLSGLMPKKFKPSKHLHSRAEVGSILREKLPVTEFHAGPIIGSGSASFEMVRYLTERLPVMVAPKWIDNEIQPVSIRDALSYLLAALDREPAGIIEIGGDRLTFRQMMEVFAEVRGLRRRFISIPLLAPKLASMWVGLITPVPNSIAAPLIAGMLHPLIADTSKAATLFPDIAPITYRRAVRLALDRTWEAKIETRWTDAAHSAQAEDHAMIDEEGLFTDLQSISVNAPPTEVFARVSSLGGDKGWLTWDWAWRARGVMDRIIGGPGLLRGRRHPKELRQGEVIDFWRVEKLQRPNLIRLRAEMKLPGTAWLEWELNPEGEATKLVQRAIFAPRGLGGLVYWYALLPFHHRIFKDLALTLARDETQKAA